MQNTINELLEKETELRELLIDSGSSTMDLINELIEISIELEKLTQL